MKHTVMKSTVMKSTVIKSIGVLVFAAIAAAGLAFIKTASAQEVPGATKPKLSTDLRFSDMDVRGKYQYADEALALVEDEKRIDDLLGIRSDFKDRLRRETKRK